MADLIPSVGRTCPAMASHAFVSVASSSPVLLPRSARKKVGRIEDLRAVLLHLGKEGLEVELGVVGVRYYWSMC